MKLNTPNELGDYLQLQRNKLQRTQTDVASYAGLQQKTISAIENAAATSRIETLFKVAHELGLCIELTPKNTSESAGNNGSGWDQEW